MTGAPTVGVLALQGDFVEHAMVLNHLGASVREVRLPQDLEDLNGLIIPGGESTTMTRLLREYGITTPLLELSRRGAALWGTCAGMILLSRRIQDDGRLVEPLGLMDVEVRRNAYGRQVDSFEEDLSIPALGAAPFHAVFIRAPAISQVGKGVEVLATRRDGSPVAVRQGPLLATAFHPELTPDPRFHAYFLSLCKRGGAS
ncbi:MAG: pyridoxal 5'-phosphate synthase glutaminase subunit PdxT [Chloroflexi bacterium]|nr:pyridoxal 5'-phosphate synthase glutaminase subunit PdxT [Chloroflexota bacterium]